MKIFKLKTLLISEDVEDVTATANITKYDPKFDFEKFQKQMLISMSEFKKNLEKNLLGREVAARAAKGYGQMEQTHVVFVNGIDVVLYQDRYTILLKGTEGRSKKESEYYVDPTANVSMKIRSGGAKHIEEPSPEQPHKPVVRPQQQPRKPTPRPQLPTATPNGGDQNARQ